jgi:hypothetical protein
VQVKLARIETEGNEVAFACKQQPRARTELWHVTNPPFQPRISEDNSYTPHSGVERQDSLKAAGFRE